MRVTVTLDDELLASAHRCTGISDTTALLHEALRAFIEREAARRLARMGGTQPGLRVPARRRTAPRAGQ